MVRRHSASNDTRMAGLGVGPAVMAAVLAASLGAATAQTPTPDAAADPFAWLEDLHSSKALDWVAGQNKLTAARLEADPRFETFRGQAMAVLTAADRIAFPRFLGAQVSNFWQDGVHVKGVWRVSPFEAYAAGHPQWRILLDLDSLSRAEGKNWIFKGAQCLPPEERYCLVHLSNGGGDAVEEREFDVQTGQFVEDGFRLPSSKQSVAWLDRDTLLVAGDWGAGSLTHSGYPFVVKTLRRGQPTDAAQERFRGSDTEVRAFAEVLRDAGGVAEFVAYGRNRSFFETQWWVAPAAGGAAQALQVPARSDFRGYVAHRMIFRVNEDGPSASGDPFVKGDIAAVDPTTGRVERVFHPSRTQAVDEVDVTRDRVLISLLDNVQARLEILAPAAHGWAGRQIALPLGTSLTLRAADSGSERAFVSTEGFIQPPTLWSLDVQVAGLTKVAQLPPRFDAAHLKVEQRFAVSADGMRVPYFLVHRDDRPADGKTPTLMFGYGGFQISETPAYKPELGRLWLERGGAYVLANLRGGGEFGPAWHDSALREHRQRAFDDFAAIARDLSATGVTSPAHLGIYGRSNGGILTSVSITQHPELFGAVVIESPLIDMLRYSHLSAGASWIGEYGDPDDPGDREFIAAYSAYQHLRPGLRYPEPYITTNTEDDRVHPGHARKFAAALEALGAPVLYYENTFGGHANDADPELNARRWARHYVYLSQKLMDSD